MAETKQFNATGTHVLLHNRETDGLWECPVGVASDYVEYRGWEYAVVSVDPFEGLIDEPPVLFDPSEHDVDGVSAHLATHAQTNPGEVERVLDLERQGRNRTTITVPEGFDPIVKEN